MSEQAKPPDVLVKVPVTFNALKKLANRKTGWKPPNVLDLPKLCTSLVKDTSDPLGILEELIGNADAIFPDKTVTFYVVDMTTFDALRVLHKRRVIQLRALFFDDACVEQDVNVLEGGQLVSWPSSVLDLDDAFIDELLGKQS